MYLEAEWTSFNSVPERRGWMHFGIDLRHFWLKAAQKW